MSVLFNHAIRHEFLPQGTNPITMVRQSGKRMKTPDILEVSELNELFNQLSHRDRAMTLLDTVTGLRRSELIGLKWSDVDFEKLELSVARSVYRQRVGRCKTEISKKPVPLDPWVAEELLSWKRVAPYKAQTQHCCYQGQSANGPALIVACLPTMLSICPICRLFGM